MLLDVLKTMLSTHSFGLVSFVMSFCSLSLFIPAVLDSKAIDSNQPMNALMRLNQIRPGLQYKLLSQSGPVHAPVFTMSVDVDGTVYEASGSSKKMAKLHVAVKVDWMCGSKTCKGYTVKQYHTCKCDVVQYWILAQVVSSQIITAVLIFSIYCISTIANVRCWLIYFLT